MDDFIKLDIGGKEKTKQKKPETHRVSHSTAFQRVAVRWLMQKLVGNPLHCLSVLHDSKVFGSDQ
jgi:hypothetical protein